MISVFNEYMSLKKVLMASVKTFRIHSPINSTQEYYYLNDPPKLSGLIAQQNKFADTLTQFGVEIIWIPSREDCTNQINTRDVGFTIGTSFVVSPMKEKERQNEHIALEEVIKNYFDSQDVVYRPKQGVIEGGDIVLDNDTIYVGISQRTNTKGYQWLVENYSTMFKIIPIELSDGYLHLDVVFNLISSNVAVVLPSGIKENSLSIIKNKYKLIEAPISEQINLPTNVFSVNENTVIADQRNIVTNKAIRDIGKDVIELDFSEISKIGGSFRCSTCPIIREK